LFLRFTALLFIRQQNFLCLVFAHGAETVHVNNLLRCGNRQVLYTVIRDRTLRILIITHYTICMLNITETDCGNVRFRKEKKI